MASESPTAAQGVANVEGAPAGSAPIQPNMSPFALAHGRLGEWRRWRDVLEVAQINDPRNLSGRVLDASARVLGSSPTQGGGVLPVDYTADLGLGAPTLTTGPEGAGGARVRVCDVLEGDAWAYDVQVREPEGEAWGQAVRVLHTDLYETDGSARALRLTLWSPRERVRYHVEIDHALWLALWLAQGEGLELHALAPSTALEIPIPIAQGIL